MVEAFEDWSLSPSFSFNHCGANLVRPRGLLVSGKLTWMAPRAMLS
jgi:hypothetical protein